MRWTIGIEAPGTLYTVMSPTLSGLDGDRVRNKRSPRLKAGSIEPERTTTIGDSVFVRMERPFHIARAVETTVAKLSAACYRHEQLVYAQKQGIISNLEAVRDAMKQPNLSPCDVEVDRLIIPRPSCAAQQALKKTSCSVWLDQRQRCVDEILNGL